jgi:hypothetical protein
MVELSPEVNEKQYVFLPRAKNGTFRGVGSSMQNENLTTFTKKWGQGWNGNFTSTPLKQHASGSWPTAFLSRYSIHFRNPEKI